MNTGDTAWVLVSSALVLLMTPGLAFFYGGMTRGKSVLNMMMMSFGTIAVVSLLWVLYGFSVAFGESDSGLWGGFDWAGMKHMTSVETTLNGSVYGIPLLVFAAFQLMFAVITPALISGAIADRAKFGTWLIFVALWVSLVYFPVAHWVFDFGDADGNGAGWLAARGVLDFAGGTAVHVNAGAAGLALAIVLGKRVGWKRDPMRPHSLPLVMLGAALLWFGWFGFNAGSALGANALAGQAFFTTMIATATAMLGWMLVETVRDKKATSLGAASGAVAGLVAITPACAFVTPIGAVGLGLVAGAVCALAVGLKYKFGFDDSLDVVGVHLVGGAIGALSLGLISNYSGTEGLFYGGNISVLGNQALAVVCVGGFSFVAAFILGKLLDVTIGFRLSEEDEVVGIDQVEHLETAYDYAGSSTGGSHLTKEF
ncbi:ammonium transporter [Aeromicrobium sp.]|uniref:ammonium transporter n=1 Tax=Aeromicrobium sp. TaxID=1871063 RepID=UPI00199EAADB|nr:ammonium transporter [Aeromicrobium sp.]MBC7633075.1 ammonium transporter [Aeromicrobium sp.]